MKRSFIFFFHSPDLNSKLRLLQLLSKLCTKIRVRKIRSWDSVFFFKNGKVDCDRSFFQKLFPLSLSIKLPLTVLITISEQPVYFPQVAYFLFN